MCHANAYALCPLRLTSDTAKITWLPGQMRCLASNSLCMPPWQAGQWVRQMHACDADMKGNCTNFSKEQLTTKLARAGASPSPAKAWCPPYSSSSILRPFVHVSQQLLDNLIWCIANGSREA